MSDQPTVLLMVPIAPAPTGNGLAMRAAVTVQGLQQSCNLVTAVLPVSDPGAKPSDLRWLAEHSSHCELLPLPEPTEAARRWLSTPEGRALVSATRHLPMRSRLACPDSVSRYFEDVHFDVVWTMRLYLAGAALPYRDTARLILDLDEDDGEVQRAIARLAEPSAANAANVEADAYDRFAAKALPWFDTITAASDIETHRIRVRHGARNVSTLPNAVSVAPSTAQHTSPSPGRPPSILFVGNLDYPPNLEAAHSLAERLLPALSEDFPKAELHLVGAGAKAAPLARLRGVRVHGFVEDTRPLYAQASLCWIPLRAGGGSRLKILEAFAAEVPVVATPDAAAGLNVVDGEQLLIAESDPELVKAARRVLSDAQLARQLAASARRFVVSEHDIAQIAGRIEGLIRPSG